MTATTHLLETILPYRKILWFIVVLKIISSLVVDEERILFPYGNGVTTVVSLSSSSPPSLCPFPDLCYQGYTPQEVSSWYESIGLEGRLRYLHIVAFDIFVVIPMYSMFFFMEIHLCSTNFPRYIPKQLCYLPFVAVGFDFIETCTHGYAIAVVANIFGMPLPLPSEFWLKVTSFATQAKFVCLTFSVALTGISIGVNSIAYPARKQEQERNDKQS